MGKRNSWVFLVVCLTLAASACKAAPTLGGGQVSLVDTWTRPLDGMVMVVVSGGTFRMGSTDAEIENALMMCEYRGNCEQRWFGDEQPAHLVSVDSFWIDRTEVTNVQYQQCVESGACTPPEMEGVYAGDPYYGNEDYANYPVIHVTWNQAVAYCEWVGARLPTEAEWEYAARGPEGQVFPWGNTFDGLRLNYCDSRCASSFADSAFDDGYSSTAPVGSYPEGASWCGALDMAGNVWEYVTDWYDGEYYEHSPDLNPIGALWGRGRVVRGGSWGSSRAFVRSAFRMRDDPREMVIPTGFRCVTLSTS